MFVIVTTEAETINIHRKRVEPMVPQPGMIIDIVRKVLPCRRVRPIRIIKCRVKLIEVPPQPGLLRSLDIFLLRVDPTKSPH